MSRDRRYRDTNKFAADISKAIAESQADINIGIDDSHNWGDQTAEEAGKGLYYFPNIEELVFNDGSKFVFKEDINSIRKTNIDRYENKSPLIEAATWAALTFYVIGDTVKLSTGWLIDCAVAGTSLASEPTYVADNIIVESGGPTWIPKGEKSTVNTDGYPVPTVSQSGTIPAGYELLKFHDNTLPGAIYNGTITAGSGYVNGTYYDVPLQGGSGSGAVAEKIVVSGGAVTSVTIIHTGIGTGYTYLDALTCNNIYLGGTGNGFIFTVDYLIRDPMDWVLENAYKVISVLDVRNNGFVFDNGRSGAGSVEGGMRVVEFFTDDPAPAFDIRGYANAHFRAVVDGYPIEGSPLNVPTTGITYTKYDFGSRNLRRWRFEIDNSYAMVGVAVHPDSTLIAPENELTGIFFSDSFGHGLSTYAMAVTDEFLANSIFSKAGIKRVIDYSLDSTGYFAGKSVSDGNSTATGYNCKGIIDNNVFYPDGSVVSVVFCYGRNDVPYSLTDIDELVSNMLYSWTFAKTTWPNAVISVFGIWPNIPGPDEYYIALETRMQLEFDAWNYDKSRFTPISTDPDGAWISGDGHWGNPTGTGNTKWYIGADSIHPSIIGKKYLAQRIAYHIDKNLLEFGM